jgi:type I restriction enzyme S subunit
MAKLGEVCIQITDGSHNPPSGVEQSEHLMLSSKNIDDDFITLDSPRFLSHSDYIAENKRTTVSEGDLLMTIVGTIGRVAIVPEELKGICLQRSVAVIKPEREVVNNRYLMYQLQNMRPFLEKEARGVAQKGIYLKQVSQLDIKLPELEHQMQIVKVLDKASKLIFLRRQQLAKLDELVKARFVEIFGEPSSNPMGWLQTTVGAECYYIKDGPHKSLTDVGMENGYPFISVRNIVNGYIDFSTAKYISEADYKDAIKKCCPEKGDILYSKGGTTGIAKLVDIDIKFANWVHLAVLKFNHNEFNGSFFEKMLNCDYCYKQSQMLTKGIANRDLVLSAMAQIKIYKPPILLQNQFAAFVERVDQQKQTVQQSLEKLELMKKALMQEYFG